MIKFDDFNEVHLSGNCTFQFIRVNKGSDVSVNVPAALSDSVDVDQNRNILTIKTNIQNLTNESNVVTIRYVNIEQITAKKNAIINAEQFFNVRRIELMDSSVINVNYLYSTLTRTSYKLSDNSNINVHKECCFSENSFLIIEVFDNSFVSIQEGLGDRLECFLYDMAYARLGKVIFSTAQVNQRSWQKDTEMCIVDSLNYSLQTVNVLNLTTNVEKIIRYGQTNEINIADNNDFQGYKPLSASEMFERFNLFNSEDFLQFLMNKHCTEMIDSSNRTWVIENARKISIEDIEGLNPVQQKSFDAILSVYEINNGIFSF